MQNLETTAKKTPKTPKTNLVTQRTDWWLLGCYNQGVGEEGKDGQKVQTSSYKINKLFSQATQDGCSLALCTSPPRPVPVSLTPYSHD